MKTYNITVFEHQVLKVGFNGFNQSHLDSLSKWLFSNQTSDDNSQYFSLVDHGIKFKSWVGIFQIDNIYIEVLPKVSSEGDSETVQKQWRKRLCKMLSYTKTLDIRQTDYASQEIENRPLWEIFYNHYLHLVEELIKTGLIKNYIHEVKNRPALKGKLIFSKQVNKNMVHQEMFYTDASEYSRNSLLNQVIFKALRLISRYPSISKDAKSLIEDFAEIEDIDSRKINWDKIDLLRKERKTEKYKEALSFAELIIKGFNPDLNSGHHDVLGIMFDMNKLFEKYVAQKMSLAMPGRISAQNAGYVWKSRKAIPDIVYKRSSNENVILDTKWKKIASELDISTADIFQQYVYCRKFDSRRAYLVYPFYSELHFGCELVENNICDESIYVFNENDKFRTVDDCSLGVLFWKWND